MRPRNAQGAFADSAPHPASVAEKVHYAAVDADGRVGAAGHAPARMQAAIEEAGGHVIITESQFQQLEQRGTSSGSWRLVGGVLQLVASEPEVPNPVALAMLARQRRDALLDASDKRMWADYPLDDDRRPALLAYRQALRDLTHQVGFPFTIDWPSF